MSPALQLAAAPPWYPLPFVPTSELVGVLPLLVVAVGAVAVLCVDLVPGFSARRWLAPLSGAVLVVALACDAGLWAWNPVHSLIFDGAFADDRFSLFSNFVVLATALAVVALSPGYLTRRRLGGAEFYVLLLASVSGMLVLDGATNLMLVFLGIELLSIPLYVLTGFARGQRISQEGAMKYLLLGGFASGFLVYGMALVYGETGSTMFAAIHKSLTASALAGKYDPMLLAGMALLTVGLLFKVSAAPFHWWTPDVYQGAPAVVTTFMSVATKVAGFTVFLRLFSATFAPYRSEWEVPVALVAIISMVYGNVVALAQSSVKRLLAYSGIGQVGYLLIGVAVGRPDGTQASLYYLAAYAFMNTGAFAVVTLLSRRGEDCDRYSELVGLARREPWLAALMSVFMLSLAGFPLTAGFFGKFFLFAAAVHDSQLPLAIWGILTSAVSLFYYLRVILVMYTPAPEAGAGLALAGLSLEGSPPALAGSGAGSLTGRVVVSLAGAGTLVLGIFPALVYAVLQSISVVRG